MIEATQLTTTKGWSEIIEQLVSDTKVDDMANKTDAFGYSIAKTMSMVLQDIVTDKCIVSYIPTSSEREYSGHVTIVILHIVKDVVDPDLSYNSYISIQDLSKKYKEFNSFTEFVTSLCDANMEAFAHQIAEYFFNKK